MQAIVIDKPGDESVLQLGTAPDPELGSGQMRIEVAASALNRADLLQRRRRIGSGQVVDRNGSAAAVMAYDQEAFVRRGVGAGGVGSGGKDTR